MPNPLTKNLGQAEYIARIQEQAKQPSPQDRLLDFLFKEESSSGKNKKAQVKNEKGAKGNYQVTESFYTEIQAAFPEFANVTFDQATSVEGGMDRRVANAGTQIKAQQIAGIGVAPTPALVATTWLSGAAGLKPAIAKAMIESRKKKSAAVAPHIADPITKRRMNRATSALSSPQGGN